MADRITLRLRLHARTALSLLVSKNGEPSAAVWVRKSKITGERALEGDFVELTMPESLARGEKLT